ncbi:MAG TPA: hypothetical protein VEV65_09275, partial [Kineosporiaceae bacterium]|nr:hypothetical protein [Kineosporiaceae bacterium]
MTSRFGSGSVALGRGGGTVTLVEQTSFCLSQHDGDIHDGGADGSSPATSGSSRGSSCGSTDTGSSRCPSRGPTLRPPS